jgi:hypothetical protein
MPLDSDVPDADSHLFVQFYEYEKEPYKGFDFVRIMNPGDKTSVFDQPATEAHKMRFPRHWLAYQSQRGGGVAAMIGTPLVSWLEERPDDLTDGQVAELTMLGFQTAEHVAGASDAQIQRVGMGGNGLRERARNYLSHKGRDSGSAELADTKAQLAELQAQMAQLLAAQQPRGPGRPRKVTDDGQHDAATGDAGHG